MQQTNASNSASSSKKFNATLPYADLANRQQYLSLISLFNEATLKAILADVTVPDYQFLKPPTIGSLMLRGKTESVGKQFNLGEATMTQCVLRLTDSHTVGYGYVLGRNKEKATLCASIDAMMQENPQALLPKLTEAQNTLMAERQASQQDVQKTKVNFFTLVRGED